MFILTFQILASTTARRLAVIDVERGEQVMSYDNCKGFFFSFSFPFSIQFYNYKNIVHFHFTGAFNGRDRAGLAADPVCPNMAVCSCVNGKVGLKFVFSLEYFFSFLFPSNNRCILFIQGLTLFDLRMPLPLDFVYDVSI